LDSNITLRSSSAATWPDPYHPGSIYLNKGVVCVEKGTLIMTPGAKITGNTGGQENGGSAVVVSEGTFTMSAGTISRANTRGVYVTQGTFTMSGGTISGNSNNFATKAGVAAGGVFVYESTFTMNDGTITGNTSGVRVAGGTC
jgi:hypothetical protein